MEKRTLTFFAKKTYDESDSSERDFITEAAIGREAHGNLNTFKKADRDKIIAWILKWIKVK